MAVSLKASAATVAALFTLFAGVGVAQAGLPAADATDEIAGLTEAQGDGLGGLLGDGDEGNGDGGLLDGLLGSGEDDDDGIVGDVLDDATDAVDDTLDGVGGVVDDAKSDVDTTLSGVGDAVDDTVSSAVGAVEDAVDGTPAGGVVDEVKRNVDPVIDVVEQATGAAESASPGASRSKSEISVETPLGSSAPKAQQTSQGPASAAAETAQSTKNSPLSSALLEQAATPLGAPTLQLTVSAAARLDGGSAATPHNRLQATPFGQPPAAPMDAKGNEDSSSSQAPALPFGPLFPVDLPATAAAGAGAAGSALTVALLCALMLLAPRSGRLARPGPNLVGPEPCLSLPERPG